MREKIGPINPATTFTCMTDAQADALNLSILEAASKIGPATLRLPALAKLAKKLNSDEGAVKLSRVNRCSTAKWTADLQRRWDAFSAECGLPERERIGSFMIELQRSDVDISESSVRRGLRKNKK